MPDNMITVRIIYMVKLASQVSRKKGIISNYIINVLNALCIFLILLWSDTVRYRAYSHLFFSNQCYISCIFSVISMKKLYTSFFKLPFFHFLKVPEVPDNTEREGMNTGRSRRKAITQEDWLVTENTNHQRQEELSKVVKSTD